MWFRRVLAHFGFARQLSTSPDLDRTKRKHDATLRKADRVIEDYQRQDVAIEMRVVRRPR